MLSLYMGGAEINAFGQLLQHMGVDTVAISYMGLRRRIRHMDKVNLAERFSPHTRILLDSGCHTLNSSPDAKYSDDELKGIATEYQQFVQRHHDRIECYTEFDALQLGKDWIRTGRTGDEKLIPVWHEEDGIDALNDLAENYHRVGVTGTALGDRDLTPVLQRITRTNTALYGLGMTKPEQMAAIDWTGVTSTSWLSPVKFRDLIVWTGSELKRYPKKNREQGKKRHRTYFRDIGINTDHIDTDDSDELLKLSIWSWQQQINTINKQPAAKQLATKARDAGESGNAENTTGETANTRSAAHHHTNPETAPTRRTKRPVPGWHMEEQEETHTDPDGTRRRRSLPLVRTSSDSVLQCSGCYLAGKCPAFEPGAECVYDMPVEIRTRDQLAAVQAALLEMQVRRVMMMQLAEQVEGGYSDPNLSSEIDRANRMIKSKQEAEIEGFQISIKASQQANQQAAGAGVLSRLFGREASEPARELPAPVETKSVAEQMGMGIEDAEIINERNE